MLLYAHEAYNPQGRAHSLSQEHSFYGNIGLRHYDRTFLYGQL